jgi:carboxypeptidase PM20D1
VHSSPLVRYEIVSNYSLLYSVRGSNSKLKPYMLLAHLDVVPVEQEHWTVPAFDGLVKDGFIYGRGAIDFKDGVFVSTKYSLALYCS